MVFLCHPDTVKPLLSSKDNHKSSLMPKIFKPHLGNSIFVQNGPEWRRSRKLLTPTFHFKVLRHYLKESIEVIGKHTASLKAKALENVDVQESMTELTLAILLKNIFSVDAEDTDWGHAFTTATKNCDDWVARRIDKPLFLLFDYLYFRSEDGKGFQKDADTMKRICKKVIAERRALHKARGGNTSAESNDRLDFLDLILFTEDANGQRMDDDEVEAQTITFMSAGFGTTASAVSFTLYCLAKHPEYQERCYQEANEVLTGDSVEFADLNKLETLYKCFKESTRLYPPAGGIARDLTEPTEINGVVVDAGTTVIASIYGIHHNPLVWPDPEKFDPERFADTAPKRDPYSYLLFSAGPRNCIGQKFAEMQSKIILAKLIQAFKFSIPDNAEELKLVPSVILKAKDGVRITMTPR